MGRHDTGRPHVLVVGSDREDGDGHLAAALRAAGLDAETGVTSDRDAVDCLVTTDPDAVAGTETPPAVLYGQPEAAHPDRFDSVVRPGEPDRLADQVRWVVRRDAAAYARRVERLHERAAELVQSTDESDLFSSAAVAAGRALAADSALVCVADRAEGVVVRGATDGPTGDVVDASGALADVIDGGESVLLVEATAADTAPPRIDGASLVGVPVDDDAALFVTSPAANDFDTRDRRLLELLATYVEGTRSRIRSEAGLRERRGVVEQLHEGTARLAAVRTVEELSEATVDIAERILDLDTCYVGFREDDGIVPTATSQKTPDSIRDAMTDSEGGGSAAEKAIRTGESSLLTSMADPSTATATRVRYASGITVPIGDEGVFQAIARSAGAFDETDLEHAELLIAHVDATLKRLRAESTLRWNRERLAKLHASAAEMVACRDEGALWRHTVSAAADILSFDTSYLFLADEQAGEFRPVAQSVHPVHEQVTSVPLDHGIAADTYRSGESYLFTDFDGVDDADPMQAPSGGGISVPVGDVGVFQAVSLESGVFDETDLELAELLAAHVNATLDRMRAETRLREERDRLSALFENVPDAAVAYEFVDGTPLVRAVNSAFEHTFGFDADDVVGKDLDDYVVPPDDDSIEAEATSLNERLQRGESIRTECRRRTADGVSAFILHVVPLELGEENVAGFAIYTDITERQAREQALRTERDRLSALFENIPDAAIAYEAVDGETIVREVNSAFEEVFGYDSEDLLGENLDDYLVPEDESAGSRRANEQLRRGENVRMNCTRLTASGPREFLLHVVPLTLGEHNDAGFAIYTDITERQEREEELRRQNERLEEFANIVSHDLRNPLSIATGYLDLARETGSESAFDRTEAALERMDRLVENLLSLARKGQVVGETTPLDASTVAERAWVGVETSEATLELDDGIPLEADESRLLGLFENLFRNAVEHGGDRVRVTVEATPEGFAVEDDGPGIPPERRESVFEPGETTGQDGIGFGLPIVKRIAEAHGWTLELTESEAGGARFEVRL